MTRGWWALLPCLLLFGGCPGSGRLPTPLPPAHAAPPPDSARMFFPSHRRPEGVPLRWGFYQINWGLERFERGRAQQLAQLGGAPAFAMFFRDLGRPFPSEAVASNAAEGLVTMLSFELWRWGQGRNSGEMQRIADGAWDGFFRKWGEDARACGLPVLLRFGFEMNGNWFAWGAQPELFRQAWCRAQDQIRAAGADNVYWVFCPNVMFGEMEAAQDIEPYYPGDARVDLVALDGYNFGDGHDEYHRWQSYDEVFGASLDALAQYPQPLLIAEIGCADDARKPAWIADFLQRAEADPRIWGFLWFNLDNTTRGEPNWRIDSDSSSLATFQRWARR